MSKKMCFRKRKGDDCAAPTTLTDPNTSNKRLHSTKQRVPEAGLHMNVRDLGGSPGDVRPHAQSNKESVTITQEQQARPTEKKNTVAKMRIKKRKSMGL